LRLDFNVLWVDDQPERIASLIRAITTKMEQQGFEFNPTQCKSTAEVKKKLGADVFTDQIDLILVDWDLGGNIQGQDAIATIREAIPYKDVVFYSARNPAEALRKLAFEKGAEGIYCASREELVDEVIGVFESLVKKVLDLDHTRGIVMGATSDIDSMVNECLTAIHVQCDETAKQGLFKEALEFVEKKIKASTMAELFKEHLVFTANDRLRMLARALEGQKFQLHKSYRKSVTTYIDKVVPQRNLLGHVARVRQGEVYVLTDGKGKVISLEDTRKLRQLILGLRADFKKLVTILNNDTPVTGATAQK
jgi:CheY-like chemotaxis protein